MSRSLVVLAAAVTVLVAPFAAQAQDALFADPHTAPRCSEGRGPVEGGYCCWPGQHATDDGRCVGPPFCPAGLVASGAECVPPVVTTAPYGGGSPSYGGSTLSSTLSPAPSSTRVPHGGPPAGPEMGVDGPLIGAGVTLILVGWLGAGITDTFGGTQTVSAGYYSYTRAPSLVLWPFGWVPFVHPLAALNANGSWGAVAGVVGGLAAALEITGIILAAVGSVRRPRRRAPASWSLRGGPAGSELGATLAFSF